YPYSYSSYYPDSYGYYPDYSYSDYGAGLDSSYVPSSATLSSSPSLPLAQATTTAQADAPATVTLIAPVGAQVWFGEWKAPAGATELATPALKPGRKYSYQVRATWKQDGKAMSQSRSITVSSGQHVRLTFPMAKDKPDTQGH